MQHRDKVIICKVISEIDIGTEILGNCTCSHFLGDELLKRAIGMTVINIGELIKNISMDLRKAYPDVPWREVAGFRDMAAHKYQTLRMEDVYQTVKVDFPNLKHQLNGILSEEGSNFE